MFRSHISKGLAGVAAGCSAYTGVTAYNTLSHRRNVDPNFSSGSADDMLNDKLQTGDVILFSRRWYNYHLPQALMIKLYQVIHDTSYDHLGVIVCDKYGTAYLFEQTFFGGYRVRLFEPRIMYSRAHQITAIMLMPREGKTPDSSAVDDYVSRSISKGGGPGGWRDDYSNIIGNSNTPVCSKLDTLKAFYEKLGLKVVADDNFSVKGEREKGGIRHTKKMTCRDLLSRRVTTQEKDKREKGRYLSPTEVLVRTT